MGRRRRWLAPLTYAAATIALVFEGVLILLRNWRLLLLQLAPAAWIWVMTRELKAHVFAGQELPTLYRRRGWRGVGGRPDLVLVQRDVRLHGGHRGGRAHRRRVPPGARPTGGSWAAWRS